MTAPFSNGDIRRAALMIICLATLLRILWAALVPVAPVSDQVAYLTFATNIALHGVYGWTPAEPTAYWAVGTAAIYGALFKVFGVAFWPIVILNIVIGTTLVAMTMALARILYGDRVALVAGAVMALWPSQILFVTVLASELPFMLLIVAAAWAWLNTGWPSWGRGVTVGLLLAGASYIRPVAILLPFVLAISLGFPRWPGGTVRQHATALLVAVLVMAVSIAPWTVRNYRVFGSFVLISTNGGAIFWMGNNPDTTGGYMPLPKRVSGLDEVERSTVLGAEAMDYVVENPGLFALRTLKKVVQLHVRETIAVHWNLEGLKASVLSGLETPLKLLTTAYWSVALGLALAAIATTVVQIGWRTIFLLPVAVWGYLTAVHATTVADDRYHFAAIPFIALLASAFLCRLMEFAWARESPPAGKGAGA